MGLGATGIGVLIAAPAMARLVLNIPLGKLCDSVGRKPLMRYGTLVTATGCVGTGAAMSHGLPAVLCFRMLVGAGSGASMTGSSAMMADLTDRAPQHRARIMGFQSMVLSGVWVVGPVLGGVLCELYGAQNSFYLAGVGIALCSFGYSQLPETLRRAADGASSDGAAAQESSSPSSGTQGQMLPLLRSVNVQSLSALALATSVSQACFMSVLTLHAREAWGASAAELGVMCSTVGISYVLGMPAGSWLAGKIGRKALIVPGLLLSHLSFGGLAFCDSRESFFALLILSNLSIALTSPALGAFTAEVLPREMRGRAMAVSRQAADIASLGAPVALGALADYHDCSTSIVATSVLCGGCVAFFGLRANPRAGIGGWTPTDSTATAAAAAAAAAAKKRR